MSVNASKTVHFSEDDPVAEKIDAARGLSAWDEAVPPCWGGTAPTKGMIYGRYGHTTASYGFDMYGISWRSEHNPVVFGRGPLSHGVIFETLPELKGCIAVADMFATHGIVETMDAKHTEMSSGLARRREIRPAPELYPDLDLDRIKERAAELRAAPSDSDALSMVLGRSVQIVVHGDE